MYGVKRNTIERQDRYRKEFFVEARRAPQGARATLICLTIYYLRFHKHQGADFRPIHSLQRKLLLKASALFH